VRWRVEVEANDVLQLQGELGVVAQLEGPHEMRFEPVRAPDAADGRGADLRHLGHVTRAPLGRVRWVLLRRESHDLCDLLPLDPLWPAAARRVLLDPGEPLLCKAVPPKSDGLLQGC